MADTFAEIFTPLFRDFEEDLLPESGPHNVRKSEARAVGTALDTAFADIRSTLVFGGVSVYKTTRALLDADLAHNADTVAAVTADPTPANNGLYVKVGASGTGSWPQLFEFLNSAGILASLTAYVDDAIGDEVTDRDDAIAAAVAAEADIRLAADEALDERLVEAEEAIEAVAAVVGARDATLARVSDGLGVLAGTWRNHTATATLNKAINTTGAFVTATGRYATDFIEVTPTSVITRMGSPVTSGSYVPVAFYATSSPDGFLGFAWAASDVTLIDIAAAPVGTKFVRLTATNATVEYYVYEPGLIAREKDKIFSLYGTPIDKSGNMAEKYVNKTTGVVANSSSFRMTALLPVGPTSYIACGGGLISNTDTTQAQLAFYDAAEAYLGYYNPVAVNQLVKIADLFPTATGVRVTFDEGATGPVHVINDGGMLDLVMDMVQSGSIVDYFDPALVDARRLTLTGGTTQAEHEYWRTSKAYIPVVEGQVFYVSAQDVSSLGAVIAGYTDNEVFVSNLLVGSTSDDFLLHRVVVPAGVAKVRGTYRNDVAPFALLSVRSAQAAALGAAADVVYLTPENVYGRVGEPVFIMARGIVGDRAVPVAFAPHVGDFDEFYGVEKLRVKKSDTNPASIKVQAAAGSKTVALGTINLRLSNPATVISPAVARTVIWIGDSTVSQLSMGDGDSVDGDGTCVNECCRQLTGVGLQALTPDVAKMTISAPFVTGNSTSGTITDGVTPKTVGPVAFTTDSDTTLTALAAAIQAKVLEYSAAAGSTAVRSGPSDILVTLKTPVAFSGFLVTGGASQATFTDTFTPFSGSTEVDTGREWGKVADGDIRAALALTNIHFRGTRGTGPVKHEGRGGWHLINYLQRDDTRRLTISAPFVTGNSISGEVTDGVTVEAVGPIGFTTDSATTLAALAAAIQTAMLEFGTGPTAAVADADEITLRPKFNLTFQNFIVTGGASQATIEFPGDGKFNAFWDPGLTPWGEVGATSQFSLKYYIENNGWDVGSIGSGVATNGSNLLVIIDCTWNDYGNETGAGPSAGHLKRIMDRINLEYPGATVWVLGIQAPMEGVFQSNASDAVEKYYSAATIFRDATQAYGAAYRSICADRAYSRFIQTSQQLDPDYIFSKSTRSFGPNTTDPSFDVAGTASIPHMRRRGLEAKARIVADAFLHHFCQP